MVNCIVNRGASPDLFSLVKTLNLVYNILTAPTGGMSTFNPNIMVHVQHDREADTEDMVRDAANAMHLNKNETKLLFIYCFKCITGFAPSAGFLSKQVGVTTRTIYNIRKRLEDYGILDVGETYMYLNWNRLRQIAMANPIYTSRDYWDKYDKQKFRWTTEEILQFTVMPAEEQAKRLHSMTEAEYQSYQEALAYFNRHKDRLLTELIKREQAEFRKWFDDAFGDHYIPPEPDYSIELPGVDDPVPF